MDITTRQKRIIVAGIGAICAAALVGVLIPVLPTAMSPQLALVLSVLALAGLFLAILPYWRALDHMQRDSRLVSFYWGGGFGAAVGLVLPAVYFGVRSPMFAGAALVWALLFAGYAAARAAWWFAHRPEAS